MHIYAFHEIAWVLTLKLNIFSTISPEISIQLCILCNIKILKKYVFKVFLALFFTKFEAKWCLNSSKIKIAFYYCVLDLKVAAITRSAFPIL
jgi:hypothetical protein